jgi:tRNA(Ile)-lysidine synthase
LRWEGPKPPTRIQESARDARYGLLASLAARTEPRPCAVAVAHHRDDQAETLLMRLSRGSGIDGLSAMQPSRLLATQPPVKLVRPLLSVPKSRLVATLEALGQSWIEDPSNAIVDYERVRLRNAHGALEQAGLTGDKLASSARRLARARTALDHATHDLGTRAVSLNGGAYASIDETIFAAAPEELRLRLLQRLLACFGGASPPARLSQLEALTERIATPPPRIAASLGGCLVRSEASELRVYREPGRKGLPHLRLRPGDSAVWDCRFSIEIDARCPQPIDIRAITPGILTAHQRGWAAARTTIPRRAALTLPGAWDGDRFLAPLHPALAGLRAPGDTDVARFVAASFIATMDERSEPPE